MEYGGSYSIGGADSSGTYSFSIVLASGCDTLPADWPLFVPSCEQGRRLTQSHKKRLRAGALDGLRRVVLDNRLRYNKNNVHDIYGGGAGRAPGHQGKSR